MSGAQPEFTAVAHGTVVLPEELPDAPKEAEAKEQEPQEPQPDDQPTG